MGWYAGERKRGDRAEGQAPAAEMARQPSQSIQGRVAARRSRTRKGGRTAGTAAMNSSLSSRLTRPAEQLPHDFCLMCQRGEMAFVVPNPQVDLMQAGRGPLRGG